MADDIQAKREASLRVLDMLQSGLPPHLQDKREHLALATQKLRSLNETLRQEQSGGCLKEWLYVAAMVLRYFLCVCVFRVDREFVGLGLGEYLRQRRAPKEVSLPQDSPILCAHRALAGLIDTLPEVRRAVETSDAAALHFHGAISRMAWGSTHPWTAIFEAVEGMGVPPRYAVADRERGFTGEDFSGTLMLHFYLREALEGRPVPAEHWKRWGKFLP